MNKKARDIIFFIFFKVQLFNIIYAASQPPFANARPLVGSRIDNIYHSDEENGDDVLWPPNCATLDSHSCLGLTVTHDCSTYYSDGSFTFSISCLCTFLSSATCPACSTGINNQLYLAWISFYCSQLSGWRGIDPHWKTDLPAWNLVHLESYNLEYSYNRIFYSNSPFNRLPYFTQHEYLVAWNPPNCILTCDWLNLKWNNSLVDGSVATALINTNIFSPRFANGQVPQAGRAYLDLTSFCTGWSWNDLQGNCSGPCSETMRTPGLLYWLNETCGAILGFGGLPDNWTAHILTTDPRGAFPPLGSFETWPSCLDVGSYADCQLESTKTRCTMDICDPDSHKSCVFEACLDLGCFCSSVNYGSTCTENCKLSWERGLYLNWLNEICMSLGPSTSLPPNWKDLLTVQRSELLPWNWELAREKPSNGPSQGFCPSASGKLLAFASVNIALALLIPIIGRRTVIKKLTFGVFGQQESRRFYITGPISVALHLASNAVNAIIIKRTPGFEHISVKNLTFFWCTRPRIAWLVVALLPYQAEKAMYFSTTASTLFSEAILQLLGGYYMGIGADYARRQKFFLYHHLLGSWYAKEAMIMYSGSILWLTVVTFAIAVFLWSILGVSERIKKLGEYWAESQRIAREKCILISRQQTLVQIAKSNLLQVRQVPWEQELQQFQKLGSDFANMLNEEWVELAATWKRMPDELREEENKRHAIKSRAQKTSKKLAKTRNGTAKWQDRWQENETAKQVETDMEQSWLATPEIRQEEARNRQAFYTELDPWQGYQFEATMQRLCNQYNPAPQRKTLYSTKLRMTKQDLEPLEQKKSRKVLWEVLNPCLGLLKSKTNLVQNWAANEEQWRIVAERRRGESVEKAKIGHFPIIVIGGMALCWVSQWLWWAGYIGVAGDGYCPPRLPLIASIWTIFSGLGTAFGTSF